jgi:hypothetical protein
MKPRPTSMTMTTMPMTFWRRGKRGAAATLRGAAACLLAGTVALACTPPHPPAARPYPPPAADDLLRAVTEHQAAVRAVNARARATSWIGGDRLRATVLMLIDRGGRLRFEAEVSLQGTVATLATDQGRFQLLDLHKNELQQGPACPANVASLIRIPLVPAEVAAILLGDVKLPDGVTPAAATVGWDAASGADVLSVTDGDRETRVLLRARGGGGGAGAGRDIVGASATRAGRTLWRTAYEDLDAPSDQRLPSLIRFAENDGSFDDGVEIKIKDRTLNPALRAQDFTIAPPAGARVIDVGCGK